MSGGNRAAPSPLGAAHGLIGTDAISSVIIVGAIIAALSGESEKIFEISNLFGYAAIILAAVNIFGGFLVTQRMLAMYKKNKDKK